MMKTLCYLTLNMYFRCTVNLNDEIMNLSKIINILLILIGGFIAFYAQAGANQNEYVLVGGIFILMTGVYRISRNIPSKYDRENSTENHDEF